MKNLSNDNEWIWDKNKFINRKYMMQEQYQNYINGDDVPISKVKAVFIRTTAGAEMLNADLVI